LALMLLLSQLLVDVRGVAWMARQALQDVLDHCLVGRRRLVAIRDNILDDVTDFAREILVLVLFAGREDSIVARLVAEFLVVLLVLLLGDLFVGDQRALLCSVTVPVAQLACGALIDRCRITDRNR